MPTRENRFQKKKKKKNKNKEKNRFASNHITAPS
jgi:hypothetical protein